MKSVSKNLLKISMCIEISQMFQMLTIIARNGGHEDVRPAGSCSLDNSVIFTKNQKNIIEHYLETLPLTPLNIAS